MKYFSKTTILTDNPSYFAFNSLTFQEVAGLQCIRDEFDPIVNPSFSFFEFVRGGSFFWWTLSGFIVLVGILALRGLMAYRTNFWTFYRSGDTTWKVWLAYAFNELAFSSVLYAHYYIYSFQYFAGLSPCLKMSSFAGVEPFFDSSLYLILNNLPGFMGRVLPIIGLLGLLLAASNIVLITRVQEEDKTFLHPAGFLVRVLAYIAFLLLGRLGVFVLLGPTAINDPTEIILHALQYSYTGFIGFIPELALIMLLAASSLL
jgi:hypothetical protein